MFYKLYNWTTNYIYWTWVRPFWKWLLQAVTGKCELLRITDSDMQNYQKTLNIEKCLHNSRSSEVRDSVVWRSESSVDYCASQVVLCKKIVHNDGEKFYSFLRDSLTQIHGYQQLLNELEGLCRTPFSSSNDEHEALLMQLWNSLQPDIRLTNRISKQWDNIGFQGDDPMTDFRGMGILGLQNLVYFAQQFPEASKRALSHSHHPAHGYSFAIVGINLTALSIDYLKKGKLKLLFFKAVSGRPTLRHFNQLYCFVFSKFDDFWWKEQPNIMEFSRIRKDFKKSLSRLLASEETFDLVNRDFFQPVKT